MSPKAQKPPVCRACDGTRRLPADDADYDPRTGWSKTVPCTYCQKGCVRK